MQHQPPAPYETFKEEDNKLPYLEVEYFICNPLVEFPEEDTRHLMKLFYPTFNAIKKEETREQRNARNKMKLPSSANF